MSLTNRKRSTSKQRGNNMPHGYPARTLCIYSKTPTPSSYYAPILASTLNLEHPNLFIATHSTPTAYPYPRFPFSFPLLSPRPPHSPPPPPTLHSTPPARPPSAPQSSAASPPKVYRAGLEAGSPPGNTSATLSLLLDLLLLADVDAAKLTCELLWKEGECQGTGYVGRSGIGDAMAGVCEGRCWVCCGWLRSGENGNSGK